MPGFITTHKMRLHLGQVPPGRILIQAMSVLKRRCFGEVSSRCRFAFLRKPNIKGTTSGTAHVDVHNRVRNCSAHLCVQAY